MVTDGTPIDVEMASLVEDEVWDHVSGIMFDALNEPDPTCTLCKRGVEIGAWAHYGHPNGPWFEGQAIPVTTTDAEASERGE